MFGAFVALVFLGPWLLLAITARTRWSWVPGVLLLVGAFVMFAMVEPVHGDVGGIGALGNGVLMLGAIGLSVYGVIVLAVGAMLTKRKQPDPPLPTLPMATVVAGVDKRS